MTRMSVYDPFAEVFPELFRGILSPTRGATPQALDIRIDVKENATDYVVQAELPGVARDDIHVQIDGNRVSISAEVKRESEQKEGDRVLRSERYYGSLARSFSLANDIDEAAGTMLPAASDADTAAPFQRRRTDCDRALPVPRTRR